MLIDKIKASLYKRKLEQQVSYFDFRDRETHTGERQVTAKYISLRCNMNYWLIVIWTAITALVAIVRARLSYWQVRGVAQLKNNSLWQNFKRISSVHNSALLQEVYDEFKGKVKVAGAYIYLSPTAVVLDLELVKTVLIRDFAKFSDRFPFDEDKEKLSKHLFVANTDTWKSLRAKLTPTFTSGKMKFMFPTIVEVSQKFSEAFGQELERSVDHSMEMHDMNARFTTDVIGTCVFGVECNSLKNPDVEFRRLGRKIFRTDKHSITWRMIKGIYMKYARIFNVRRFPLDVEEFFVRIVNDTVLERERRNIHRNDFVDLLIELKNKKDENGNPTLSLDSIAAQLFVFFAAGFETSSSNMSYGLFELARNPDKQDKLRNEIMEVLKKYNNQFTYEAMMEMTYLDQVISETLRMYPALAGLTRVCMENYTFPGTDITLEKGTRVFIPVKAIHYDPEIYENPNEFRPERFDPAEVQQRHPQSFLGFGDGPRNCIGLRFGRMQVKIGLVTLLSKYRFSPGAKTPDKIENSKYSFVLIPANGVWLRAETL